MRIIFIGAVEFSKTMFERLVYLGADICGVLTKRRSDFNSDFVDLSEVCIKNKIPYRYFSDINSEDTLKWIKGMNTDVIFCFGLSQVLKKDLLNSVPLGIIGHHPASLPQNRGRHPIIWALVLGLPETASTFFFMDKGVDSGDILSQQKVSIKYDDNARTLYNRITKTALKQMEFLLPKLENNSFSRLPQDNKKANYWRKRSEKDGRIDFRMTSGAIYNLVRALARPYCGAHIEYKGKKNKVWAVKEIKSRVDNIECGKVLDIRAGRILVKCYDNAILVTEHEFRRLPKRGGYLI